MLIPFPIAFLSGAVLFDAAGWLFNVPGWTATAGHLNIVGIASALVAAIPGLIDYWYTVPPKSSGKTRATKHMILNLAAIAWFAAAWAIRGRAGVPALVVLGVELIGVALLSVGGYMGGTLVTRNLISVEPRYARTGKWREATIEVQRDQPTIVAQSDELQIDQMKLLHVDGKRIVLARTEKGYVAFDDRCTHRGGSLAAGVMVCGTVQCLWHGSQFDAATGKVHAGPAKEDVHVYRVTEEHDRVRLFL